MIMAIELLNKNLQNIFIDSVLKCILYIPIYTSVLRSKLSAIKLDTMAMGSFDEDKVAWA
jgi:hypothetical protein